MEWHQPRSDAERERGHLEKDVDRLYILSTLLLDIHKPDHDAAGLIKHIRPLPSESYDVERWTGSLLRLGITRLEMKEVIRTFYYTLTA